MKHRIALVSSKLNPSRHRRSDTTWIDVADLSDLARELAAAGARRATCFSRDRFGAGRAEGQPFAVAKLSADHLAWLLGAPKDNVRALYYDTKA